MFAIDRETGPACRQKPPQGAGQNCSKDSRPSQRAEARPTLEPWAHALQATALRVRRAHTPHEPGSLKPKQPCSVCLPPGFVPSGTSPPVSRARSTTSDALPECPVGIREACHMCSHAPCSHGRKRTTAPWRRACSQQRTPAGAPAGAHTWLARGGGRTDCTAGAKEWL
jgi:hypothetical protein